MSHRTTNLTKRAEIARSALQFVGVLEHDKEGRARVFSVPGSEGKVYRVILRRTPDISVECHLIVGGDNEVICKGNTQSDTVCYHGLMAVAKAAELAGKKVSFCENDTDAVRLSKLGGRVLSIRSWQSNKKVWGVVK